MSLDFTGLPVNEYQSAKPKKFNFLNSLSLDKEVISKLSLNLNSIYFGSEDVYLTPIGKDNDIDELVSGLDDIFSRNKDKINNNLENLEQGNKSKLGPRSIAKPWKDRLPTLLDYFEHQEDPQNRHLTFPNDLKNIYRPLELKQGVKYLKNDTNSGLPFYTRKSNVKDRLISEFRYLLNREDPCILFTRTQEGGKTRNVWGYPIADTLNETLYYQPLLAHQSKESYRSALLGPDIVDRRVTDIMNSVSVDKSLVLISIDFSAYDASVGFNLQSKVFDHIKSLFQKPYHSSLDYVSNRFNNISIVTPSGVLSGGHGVPSGATFTNEVDSLCQYLVAYNSGTLINGLYQIQGDDGLYAINENNSDTLINCFKLAGLKVNEGKSGISRDHCTYLQRLYDYKYRSNGLIGGIYSLYRALNRIIYQERYSNFMDYSLKGSDYYSIRTICILENCKYHPLFKEFVKYISGKDKYLLKYNVDAISKYNRMLNDGPGTTGFLNNQFGDNVRGLNNFSTVKLLREIA